MSTTWAASRSSTRSGPSSGSTRGASGSSAACARARSARSIAYALEPRPDGGTLVKLASPLDPRFRILAPFVRLMGGITCAASRRHPAWTPRPRRAGRRRRPPEPGAARRLRPRRGRARAAEPGPALVDRLVAYVRDADDVDVSRIRPFELADAWGVDRRAVLGACLAAVRAGLLELRWEIVCPSCRTATDVLPSLASLTEHGACQLCEIEFAIELEEAVEATFAPAARASARSTPGRTASAALRARRTSSRKRSSRPRRGGPRLPAEEGAATASSSAAARRRRRGRGGRAGRGARRRRATAPPSASRSRPRARSWSRTTATRSATPRSSESSYADGGARALVTAMPGFRRDFSQRHPPPGIALKVARVGLFFSDLTGSTQLYSNVGDAAAFKLVHDHFDVVIGLVERHEGTLVKTIGDAVMAVFADDLDGLARLRRHPPRLRATSAASTPDRSGRTSSSASSAALATS